MTTPNTNDAISRRTAIAGISATGLGLALAATTHHASAQNATPTIMASHPILGVWMVQNNPPNIGIIFADGTLINVGVSSAVGPDGALGFASPGAGTWEVLDDRAIHVTFVEFHTDATGAFTGTLTFEGYPVLDEGGQTWTDDGSKVKLTFRDAAHNVTMVIGGDGSIPGVTANRMGPGVSGLPEGTPAVAIPTA
jgi:hypothetical protein